MPNADLALAKVLGMDFTSVLDVGAGEAHSRIFREHGKQVVTVSLSEADYQCDYLDIGFTEPFDLVWASHVLEHIPNPNFFLRKVHHDVREGGIVAITVPPLKHEIVGGHVNLYNAGILLYQLVLAGFDCSKASVKEYGYNISVIVRKVSFELPELKMDFGDLALLERFFPPGFKHGIDGRLTELNW